MKPTSHQLGKYGTTIFEVMSGLARDHQAINLGQGFPDGNGPDDVRRMAARALEEESNQYPPMYGVPALRRAVAEHNQRFYGLDVDWSTEVMVTSGATEALSASLLGVLNPGDEVVMFEPLYDSYVPMVELAGAIPRTVRLEPPSWQVRGAELEAAFSNATKLVVLNSPMNPSGKVFPQEELQLVAELAIKHDAYVLCDEVYEHLTFEGHRHVPLMTLPGMRDRCIRVGSAGKTFSLTGWKIGYITAPPPLLTAVARAHQYLTFTTPPNLQHAVAFGLGKDDAYFANLGAWLEDNRNLLAEGLAELGFEVATCHGTYFLNAGYRELGFKGGDEEFCKAMTAEAKVAAIPVSAFYRDGKDTGFVRFCFCKEKSTLLEALDRLGSFVAAGFGDRK